MIGSATYGCSTHGGHDKSQHMGAATQQDPPGFDLHALELGGTELFANMAFGEGFMLLGYLQRDAGDPKSEVC